MQAQNQTEKTTLEIYGEKIEQLDRIFTFSSSTEVKAKILLQMYKICKLLSELGIVDVDIGSLGISEQELKDLFVHATLASRNYQIDAEAEILAKLNEIESALVILCIEAGLIARFEIPVFVWGDEE